MSTGTSGTSPSSPPRTSLASVTYLVPTAQHTSPTGVLRAWWNDRRMALALRLLERARHVAPAGVLIPGSDRHGRDRTWLLCIGRRQGEVIDTIVRAPRALAARS